MPKTRSKASTADAEIPAKKMAQEKDLAHDTGIVVELLNDATMAHGPEKIELLRKIQERIVFKDPELLDNFLEEVMQFQINGSQEVRKFVVGFIEEACKKDPNILSRVIPNLRMMLNLLNESVDVVKRVIRAMTFLYKLCLQWLSKVKIITENMEAVWSLISEMKNDIIQMLDSDNDGIRTHAIKFMEMLVIVQTHHEDTTGKDNANFSLDDVPMTLKLIRRRKLEEEARAVFDKLIDFHGSAHISSANLMTCMSSLTGMAKSRPSLFFAKVITALEMLHANLPPTLTTSQVSSVRKHLKNQLLSLLKSGVSENLIEKFLVNAFTLLTDLGASKDDVSKAMPNFEAIMKRSKKKKSEESSPGPKAKKAKIDIPDDDDESSEDDETEEGKSLQDSAVDITEKFIKDRLDPALVTELVIRCIPNIPSSIPPQFSNSYTPIDAAGTESQIKHVSRLLAAQMTSLGVGPGVKEIREKRSQMPLPKIGPDSDEDREKEDIGVDPIEESRKMRSKVQLLPAGLTTSKKAGTSRVRSLKLGEITKELTPETKSSLVLRAAQRIMNGEKEALIGGVPELRSKILTTLGARFSIMTKSALIAYIYSDFSKRIDMAFSWLYQEYCVLQRFHRSDFCNTRNNDESEYNNVFCTLIRGVIDRTEGIERENLLRRLYLESPIITDDAIEVLKGFVTIIGSAITVVNLMKDLVMRRPTKKLNCLNFLLEFCSHDSADVRQTAIQTVLQLHADSDYKTIIEPYAIMYLKFLLNPAPPTALFTEDRGRSQAMSVWMEDTVKVCLYLFLSLLPKNQDLFKNLADVYTNSKTMVYADGGQPVKVQIVILRELDLPISKVPMDSPELMDLLDDPPVGSETLITRIVHILTDKTLPSAELVAKVKKLYEDRVKDVRFLIPVLNGLSKMEVIQYLPQLIQCQTAVVKEVFMRVLSNNRGPMSPSDLLISLHTLGNDPNHTKTVVNVTKICFAERAIYDKGVLAVVLNKLMEEKDIPILFMRTVIQSLAMYPSMQGFIINILQRLITKQVWKQKVVWDGFIKACEKTMPQSYPVMLQLPPQQLEQFLEEAPKLREPLLLHVQNFKEHQRAHVSAKTMKVLYSDYIQDTKKDDGGEDKDGEPSVDPMAPLD